MYHLCIYPQYMQKLKEEAFEYQDRPFSGNTKDMPYMDSFIKETARLSPGLICSLTPSLLLRKDSLQRNHLLTRVIAFSERT